MAKVSITVLSCLVLIACWQVNDSDRMPFPPAIKNYKRAAHVNIPGTRVFMVPPNGFKMASEFKGIEKGDFTRIEVTDVNGASFYRDDAGFSKEKHEKAGYRVLEFKELTINDFPAKMALLRGRGPLRVYIVVFGDSTFSATVQGVYNGLDPAAGEQVWRALVSIYYDKSKEVNAYTAPVFSLNDSKSIFKFAKAESNKIFYTVRSKVKADYKTEPYVVAVNSPIEGRTLEQAADKLLLIRSDHGIGNIYEGATNGFPSLTREVFGKLDGRQVFLFQHMVLIDDTVVCMQGVAGDDEFEKYLEEFKKLSNTVSKADVVHKRK